MASKSGQVTLRGRFSKGSIVTLTKVAGPGTLRPEGGEDIEIKTVEDEDGLSVVRFSKGVEVGARYFIHGLNDGYPVQVRVVGKEKDDPNEVFEQAPIQPDRVRLTDGTWADERPTKESAPQVLAAQADLRHVKKGTQLRSDTPRGEAHPVDPDEAAPKRRQEDVKEGAPQMSDTRPRELEDGTVVGGGGEAAEIIVGPQRQEDVPEGTPQRSDTPTGTAAVIPKGNAVQQAQDRESSYAKETRGDWTRAGAEPIDAKGVDIGPPKGASQKKSEERDAEIKESERIAREATGLAGTATGPDQPAERWGDRSGYDAQGQPAYPDVANAAGLEAPEKARVEAKGPDVAPSLTDRTDPDDEEHERRSKAAKKAARTRKRNEREAEKEAEGSETPEAPASDATQATEQEGEPRSDTPPDESDVGEKPQESETSGEPDESKSRIWPPWDK